MRYLFYFIALIGIVACCNVKKDQRNIVSDGSTYQSIDVIEREVLQKDSLQFRLEDQIHKHWAPSDTMPYFILDKQILRQLDRSSLDETDKIILNFHLCYELFSRRYIYDSLIYRDQAVKLLFDTFNSDTDLVRSSIYFKTTPDKLKKYINQVRDAPSERMRDSLIWNRLNSYNRLENY